jgi:hypothetical protein
MTMLVPVQALPYQTINVQLAGQNCQLNIYTKLSNNLFMDVYSNNALVIAGVLCENLNRIVRDLYLGFVGDFCFNDTQGSSDPTYLGLGTQYQLVYLEASDLGGLG